MSGIGGVNSGQQAQEVGELAPAELAPAEIPPAEAEAAPVEGGVIDRPPMETISSDLLRHRMEYMVGKVDHHHPATPGLSFADRMAARYGAREDFTLDDIHGAETEGLKGDFNDALVDLANTDVGAADLAEKSVRDLLTDQLKAARNADPDSNVTDAHIAGVATTLAKELRTARVGGVSVESLGQGADLLVKDLGAVIARGLAFRKAEEGVKAEAAMSGGLYPGEDVELNEQVAQPLAEATTDAKEAVKERLKTDFYFEPDAKIDALKLLSSVEEAVDQVSVDTGFTFTRDDFRAKLGAEIEISDPLTKGADAKVRGYAEIGKGNFTAKVEGRTQVLDLYTDPTAGPTADLLLDMRYADSRITASLIGKASIPLQDNANLTWSAGANVGYKLNKNTTLSAGVSASGGDAIPTSTRATVGLKIRF